MPEANLPIDHPLIDQTIARISITASHVDPLLDPDLSRSFTLIGAALTHHGYLLQHSFREALAASTFLSVIDEPDVFISPMVDAFVQNHPIEACLHSQLEYQPHGRRLRPDVMVLDHRDNTATFHEMRRAASPRGSGKWRGTILDILALRVIAASYARSLGYGVAHGSAFLVAYYGGHRMPLQLVLDRAGLDRHFRLPIVDRIEADNRLYKEALRKILRLPTLIPNG